MGGTCISLDLYALHGMVRCVRSETPLPLFVRMKHSRTWKHGRACFVVVDVYRWSGVELGKDHVASSRDVATVLPSLPLLLLVSAGLAVVQLMV